MTSPMPLLRVSSNFDAGAIEIEDVTSASDLRVRLRADSHADIR